MQLQKRIGKVGLKTLCLIFIFSFILSINPITQESTQNQAEKPSNSSALIEIEDIDEFPDLNLDLWFDMSTSQTQTHAGNKMLEFSSDTQDIIYVAGVSDYLTSPSTSQIVLLKYTRELGSEDKYILEQVESWHFNIEPLTQSYHYTVKGIFTNGTYICVSVERFNLDSYRCKAAIVIFDEDLNYLNAVTDDTIVFNRDYLKIIDAQFTPNNMEIIFILQAQYPGAYTPAEFWIVNFFPVAGVNLLKILYDLENNLFLDLDDASFFTSFDFYNNSAIILVGYEKPFSLQLNIVISILDLENDFYVVNQILYVLGGNEELSDTYFDESNQIYVVTEIASTTYKITKYNAELKKMWDYESIDIYHEEDLLFFEDFIINRVPGGNLAIVGTVDYGTGGGFCIDIININTGKFINRLDLIYTPSTYTDTQVNNMIISSSGNYFITGSTNLKRDNEYMLSYVHDRIFLYVFTQDSIPSNWWNLPAFNLFIMSILILGCSIVVIQVIFVLYKRKVKGRID